MRRGLLAGTAVAIHILTGVAAAGETPTLEKYEQSATAFSHGLNAQERAQTEDAMRAYRRAIELDPSFVEAMANLSRLHLAEGDTDSASVWLDRAAAIRSDYPEIYKVRGLVALAEERPHDALAALNRALKLTPEDVEVLSNLGVALLELGIMGEARSVLERAVDLEANCAPCTLNLALVADRSGDERQAAFMYRRFLELTQREDPDLETVQGRIRILQGRR